MRERVDQLGVAEPEIQPLGNDQISVGLPGVKNAERANAQVGTGAQLYLYDWERTSSGRTASPIRATRRSPGARRPAAPERCRRSTPRSSAPRSARRSRTSATARSSTPAGRSSTCSTRTQAAGRRAEETTRDLLESYDGQAPPGSEVAQGHAGHDRGAGREAPGPADAFSPGYYVLNDNPSLTRHRHQGPEQDVLEQDQRAAGRRRSASPTAASSTFQDVTRTPGPARRRPADPGRRLEAAFQHFAMSSTTSSSRPPFIDYQQNPDGIGGETGAQIEGGFTVQSAQDLAKILQIGALPIKLKLICSRRSPPRSDSRRSTRASPPASPAS